MAITDAEISNPNVRKFLDFTAAAEGTTNHGYNTQVGGSKFDDLSQHPNKPTVTTADGTSTAAGRYQITGTTWASLQRKHGFSDFSPVNQDRAAVALLKEKGAYEDVANGNYENAINKTGDVWASFPSSKYKQPKKSWDWANKFLGTNGPDEQTRSYNDSYQGVNGTAPSMLARKQNELEKTQKGTNLFDNVAIGAKTAFNNDSAAINWFKSIPEDAVKDPNFKFNADSLAEISKGVKPEYVSFIYNNATSADHAQQLRQRAIEFADMEKKYEEAGFGAGIARAATGLLAPENLALMGLTMVAPAAGVPLAASRLGRIGYGALEGAIGNMAIEHLGGQYRPDSSPSDVAFAGAMGVVLGGVGGAFARGFKERIRSGNPTIFDHDLANIDNWGLDQLHEISGLDYARAKMFGEGEVNASLTPEARMYKELKYAQEYDALVEKRKHETIHGTGDQRPPALDETGKPVVKPAEDFKPTWDKKWDTPTFLEHGENKSLQLPPNQPVESLIHYIRKYDTHNTAMVKWLDKMLEGIDLSKLDRFEVGSGIKQPKWYVDGHKIKDAPAHVVTPSGSLGTKLGSDVDRIQLVLQGRALKNGKRYVAGQGDWNAWNTGLHSTMLTHELVHVASTYKLRLVRGSAAGIQGDAKTIAATKSLQELYSHIKDNHYFSKKKHDAHYHYGMKNEDEFLAEGLTNAKFQTFLKGIVLPDNLKSTNAFSKFVSSVMDILGLDKAENTAFHRFLELAEPLTDEGGVFAKDRAGLSSAPASGYKVMPDSGADVDTATAAYLADLPEVFGRSLGLEHSTNSTSLPRRIWDLSRDLIGSTVGYKDHSVVRDNAYESMIMARDGWNTQLRKGTLFHFLEWEQSKGYKFHERGKAYEDFGTEVWDYVRGAKKDYDPQVAKAGEAVRKNYADRVENINNPSKEHGGEKRGLTETEITNEDGTKSYVGRLDQNPFYMPRVHDSNKWSEMVATHGRDKVESFWAAAYRSGREGEVSIKDAQRFAKFYYDRVNDAKNNTGASQQLSDMLRGQDKGALLDAIKKSLPDIDDAELAKFTDQILGTKKDDAGRIVGNLKHRNTLDELYVGTEGSPIEGWTLKDFVKTNALDITESYNNRVAGNVALAHINDVYKSSDITRLIDQACADDFGTEYKKNHLDKARKDLQFIFDRILGVPQEQGFSAVNQTASMFRDFNVIRLMSGAVYNQLVETTQITGTVGFKGLLNAIPQLEGLSRDLKTGKAPSELLDHFENVFGGAGAEYLHRLDFGSQTAWSDQYGKNSWKGKYLDKTAGAFKSMASGVLDYTGMTPLMVQQKRLHVTALVNGFVDLAHGIDGGSGAFLTKDRLAWMGLSEDDFGRLKVALKKYSTEGEGAIKDTAKAVDWDKFQANETELHHKMARAVMRESRRVIQENDLASMIPFMGSTLGKTMFQFMNFSMNAWNKQMLFGMNHADAASLNTLFQGVLLGSLVYSARMYQQSLGMEEEEKQKFLDDHLSIGKVVANGWSRTGSASMLPNMAASFLPSGMGGDLFNGSRTTSASAGFMSTPTMQLFDSAVALGKKVATNATDENRQMTKSDARALFRLMPYNNLIGVNNILNVISNDLPTASKIDSTQ
jgi:muramidase (phage lysozyme)